MPKKIRLTMTIEYIPEMKYYPGCKTIEEAMKMDLQNDPYTFFDGVEIKGEIVDG